MKRLKFPPGTPVCVLWEDSMASVGWTNDREDLEVGHICTVGLVVKDTPKAMKITSSMSQDGTILSPLTIPSKCIRKVFKVEEVKEATDAGNTV